MFEWWNSLGITMQVFYCIALPATLIIVIQTILLMIGIGHGGEGVEFSDTSGIDGLGDVPDMPADIPTDMPGAHAIDGCELRQSATARIQRTSAQCSFSHCREL